MNNNMLKIDLKDRKILYQLDIDSRQSYSQIAKKVGLSKTVLVYRINRLKEKGVIRKFYTVIDSYRLGYLATRFHYLYQYVKPEIKKEIIDYFTKYKYSMLVASVQGYFDLSVILWVRDISEFYRFWEETQNKYGYYLQDQVFTFYLNEVHYRPSYLLLDDYKKSERTKLEFYGGGKKVKIDNSDIQIMNEIARNARMPLTDIANKLNSSSTMINYRIKKLIKLGIIQGFRTEIDISKLGYHAFKVYIFLKEFKHRSEIINYVKFNPNLVCIDTTTGETHLELEFHLENIGQLYQIMQDLIKKFPNVIRNYKSVSLVKRHKYRYMPEF